MQDSSGSMSDVSLADASAIIPVVFVRGSEMFLGEVSASDEGLRLCQSRAVEVPFAGVAPFALPVLAGIITAAILGNFGYAPGPLPGQAGGFATPIFGVVTLASLFGLALKQILKDAALKKARASLRLPIALVGQSTDGDPIPLLITKTDLQNASTLAGLEGFEVRVQSNPLLVYVKDRLPGPLLSLLPPPPVITPLANDGIVVFLVLAALLPAIGGLIAFAKFGEAKMWRHAALAVVLGVSSLAAFIWVIVSELSKYG